MKKIAIVLTAAVLLASCLAGCRPNVPQDTTGSITPGTTTEPSTQPSTSTTPSGTQGTQNTGAVKVLQSIWDVFGGFAAYGGSLSNPVDDAPGALDVTDAEEMTNRYLIPQNQLAAVAEGASLVHMMNSNIFSAVALKLSDGQDSSAFAKAWRDAIQGNNWICGQPDRLVIAQTQDGYLIMAFGSTDLMRPFGEKLANVHANAKTLYDEAIVA